MTSTPSRGNPKLQRAHARRCHTGHLRMQVFTGTGTGTGPPSRGGPDPNGERAPGRHGPGGPAPKPKPWQYRPRIPTSRSAGCGMAPRAQASTWIQGQSFVQGHG